MGQDGEPFSRKLNERGLAVAIALHETDASDGGKNRIFIFWWECDGRIRQDLAARKNAGLTAGRECQTRN